MACALSGVRAGNVYLNENFNAGIPSTLRVANLDGMNVQVASFNTKYIQPSKDWFVGEANDADGKALLSTSRRQDATAATSNWFLTAEPITISSDNVWLRWDARSLHHDLRDGYRVCVFTQQDMSDLIVVENVEAEEYCWTTRLVSLKEFYGKTVYVAFEHNATNKFVLAIDNLFMGELSDVKVEGKNTGRHFVGNDGTATISVEMRNLGRKLNPKEILLTTTDGHSQKFPCQIEFPTNGTSKIEIPLSVELNKRYDYTLSIIETDGTTTEVIKDFVFCSNYPRTLVVEKFTGMWCNSCTMATPFVRDIEHRLGDDVSVVEVHGPWASRDKLSNDAYCSELTMNNYPTVLFNRNNRQDGNWNNESYLNAAISTPVEAKIEAEMVSATDAGAAKLQVTVQFADDIDNSDDAYRIGLIYTEDDVRGEGFFQKNNATSLIYEEFALMPADITGDLVVFNHVARGGETKESLDSYGMYCGIPKTLPAEMKAKTDYEGDVLLEVPTTVSSADNLSVTAVLYKYGNIINAVRIKSIGSCVGINDLVSTAPAITWSNNGNGTLTLTMPKYAPYTVALYTVDGRCVANVNGNGSTCTLDARQNMTSGMYILRAQQGESMLTTKVLTK